MSNDVDAVIAALRMILHDAEQRNYPWWKVHVVNSWINQLPGAWRGRWRYLKLRGDNYDGDKAIRANLIAHVRATLAYLEVNRDAIKAKRVWRWPARKVASAAAAGKKEATKDGVQRSKLLH
jgi:hypothetical protein